MKSAFGKTVVDAIRRVADGPCALHEPVFHGNERAYLNECIDSGWVSSVGGFVDRLEKDVVAYTGAGHAIATVNGTSALHAALIAANVQRDDEVIVPALSFVATANAVAYCGAVPHFVDVCQQTLGMDPEKLERHLHSTVESSSGGQINRKTGRRVAAIVPMHTFGHPCDIAPLCELANRYGLPVVEDAAESLGSFYHGRHTGTYGRLGVLSFNGNKIVTSGGGGVVLTNDPVLAKRVRHLTTTAKLPHQWLCEHDVSGFNYRMPNLNAALACAQLEQLPYFVRVKRQIAAQYQVAFRGIDGVTVVCEPEHCESNYWLNSIRLSIEVQHLRDDVLEASHKAGFMTRSCWTPLNQLPMFRNCPSASLETTVTLFKQIINLPSGVGVMRVAK